MNPDLRASFAGRRALVTGAAGLLGFHLCQRLICAGTAVIGIDNLATSRPANVSSLEEAQNFKLVVQDVTEPFMPDEHVDFVFHLASPASPRDYLRLPVQTLMAGSQGTLNALRVAQANRARFLLASTSEVYGDPLQHPQHESNWGNVNPVGQRSVYDEAKRYAEALTATWSREKMTSAVIVRIFNTYGPRMRADDGRMVPEFIAQALSGWPLTVAGDGTQTRSLCFVDDTVDGILRAASSGHTGPINIGNPYETTVLKVAKIIRSLCDSASPITFVPRPADDPRRRRPDITAAGMLLGWEPRTSLVDGLRLTVRWAQHTAEGADHPVASHGGTR